MAIFLSLTIKTFKENIFFYIFHSQPQAILPVIANVFHQYSFGTDYLCYNERECMYVLVQFQCGMVFLQAFPSCFFKWRLKVAV